MKKSTLTLGIIILTVMLIWQFSGHVKIQSRLNNLDYLSEGYIYVNKQVNNLPINENAIVTDYNGDSLKLNNLAHEYSLFARFSANGCSACIKHLMRELIMLKDANPECNICILLSEISDRDLLIHHVQSDKLFGFYKVVNFPFDSLINPMSPYLLEIDSKGNISSNFICQYGDTVHLNNYLTKFYHL